VFIYVMALAFLLASEVCCGSMTWNFFHPLITFPE